MRRGVALATILGIAACSNDARREESAAPMPAVALPEELDRVLRDYETAYASRDAKAIAALFASDGFVLQAGRPPVRGRDAIARAMTGQGGALALVPIGYAMSDSLAHVVGTFGAERAADRGGKFVLALRREASGRWVIAADMDNANGR